jgi:hypothetical protein
MTTFRLSNVLSGFDAQPIIRPTAGQGGPAELKSLMGTITVTNGDTSSFAYRMLRLPTNAIVRSLKVALDAAATTFAGTVGLYFSDMAQPGGDGTNSLNQGVVFSASFFAFTYDIHANAGSWADITFQNAGGNSATDGFYVPSASNQPLWQAVAQGGYQSTKNFAGLGATSGSTQPGYHMAADPGGFFDIVWINTSTVSAAGGGLQLSMDCQWTGEAA